MKPITVGTDCSGIESPIEALIQMKIPHLQKWSCEIDPKAVASHSANYKKAETVYTDMLKRKTSSLSHVDLYVCGFPCQAFSNMGRRRGMSDPRAKIIPKMIQTIGYCKPKVCILENVRGFVSIQGGKPLRDLVSALESVGYDVSYGLYNTRDYGLPQNRIRVYFICIRKDLQKRKYIVPGTTRMIPFESILDDTAIHPGKIPSVYRKNIYQIRPRTKIITPFNYYAPILDVSPTLLSNCYSFYVIKQNRLLSEKEALRLQGFRATFKQVVSRNQLMKQVGNAMSVNVLKVIIKEALECVEL
jgi:DNA (cytosine-5)-methyltransferase 1